MNDFEKQVLSKLTEMDASIKEIKSDITGIKTDVAGLKADVSELKTDMKEVKADVAGIKITVGGIQERTMELCEFVGTTDKDMKSMKELIIEDKIDIKTLKRKIG